jgi:hypothetical protein
MVLTNPNNFSITLVLKDINMFVDNDTICGYVGAIQDLNIFTTATSVAFRINPGGQTCTFNGSAINDGSWHVVTFRYDSTLSAVKVDVDDSPISVAGTTTGAVQQSSVPFSIGARSNGGNPIDMGVRAVVVSQGLTYTDQQKTDIYTWFNDNGYLTA